MNNAGFPAWVRVTTDKGLVPIANIQVGDKVLSKSENSEQVFKSVVNIGVYENTEMWHLSYGLVKKTTKANSLSDVQILKLSMKGKSYSIDVTPNQQFWVKDIGWQSIDKLEQGQILEMKDENFVGYVIVTFPINQTTHNNVWATVDYATFLDVAEVLEDVNHPFSQDNPQYIFKKIDNNGDREILNDGLYSKSPLRTEGDGEIYVLENTVLATVYNLEIADNHNYYVFDKLLAKSL